MNHDRRTMRIIAQRIISDARENKSTGIHGHRFQEFSKINKFKTGQLFWRLREEREGEEQKREEKIAS